MNPYQKLYDILGDAIVEDRSVGNSLRVVIDCEKALLKEDFSSQVDELGLDRGEVSKLQIMCVWERHKRKYWKEAKCYFKANRWTDPSVVCQLGDLVSRLIFSSVDFSSAEEG